MRPRPRKKHTKHPRRLQRRHPNPGLRLLRRHCALGPDRGPITLREQRHRAAEFPIADSACRPSTGASPEWPYRSPSSELRLQRGGWGRGAPLTRTGWFASARRCGIRRASSVRHPLEHVLGDLPVAADAPRTNSSRNRAGCAWPGGLDGDATGTGRHDRCEIALASPWSSPGRYRAGRPGRVLNRCLWSP